MHEYAGTRGIVEFKSLFVVKRSYQLFFFFLHLENNSTVSAAKEISFFVGEFQ